MPRRKNKDPNKPKGAKTSFIIFGEKLRLERQEKGEKIPVQSVFVKEVGFLWKELSEDDKQQYVDLAAEDKIRYQNDMKDYTPPSDESDSDDDDKPRKKKKKKDPNAPKRNMSAYFLYANQIRPQLRKENPNLKITEIAKMIGASWGTLSVEDKRPFDALAIKDRERYQSEMAEYNGK